MTVVKPTIPREVAEAIEQCRKSAGGRGDRANRILVSFAAHPLGEDSVTSERATLQRFAAKNFNDYICAVINGYEIEKSAEELAEEARQAAHAEIRFNYNEHNDLTEIVRRGAGNEYAAGRCRGYRYGVEDTLKSLGVKVEGVNA